MRTAYNVLNGLETAELIALALVALRLWWRQRDATHAWLARTFGVLGLVVAVAPFLPKTPHGAVEQVATRLLIAGIVLFPYCLYRFMQTFSPTSRRVQRAATLGTAAVCLWALLLPTLPEPGAHRPPSFVAFVVAVLVQWTVLSFLVAVRLWRAGGGQPTVARRRMRTMSVAAATLAVVLLISGTGTSSTEVHPLQLVLQVVVILVGPMFLAGFAPPGPLLVIWRQSDQQQLRQTIIGLMVAVTPEQLADNLLPRVTNFVGARGAAILNTDGTVLGRHRLTDAELEDLCRRQADRGGTDPVIVEPDALWARLSTGWLVVATTAFMPFFGQTEAQELQSIAVLADMALSRSALLQRDRDHVASMREFVAIASHDLRTPTTAISGFASMLDTRWSSLSDEQKLQMVASMSRQSQHLSRLVEDLLTTSRLDAAAVITRPVEVDVREAVRQIVDDLGVPGVSVRIDGEVTAYADPEHFRRIITNYVRNAAVYGAAPIRVEARSHGATVEVTVVDNGPGVPESFAPRLFEKFARADRKTSSATGGTGLGLSIVRGLAQAGGGKAWYAPHHPNGSVFGVTLPAPVPRQAERGERWTSDESSSSSRTRRTSAG